MRKDVFHQIILQRLKDLLNVTKYLNYNGKQKILKASGLLATCIQHEVDHLDGILFIDCLSKLKKDRIIKKLRKHKRDR